MLCSSALVQRSASHLLAGFFHDILIDSENECDKSVQNVCGLLLEYMALQQMPLVFTKIQCNFLGHCTLLTTTGSA
jgi:hypothetical protein